MPSAVAPLMRLATLGVCLALLQMACWNSGQVGVLPSKLLSELTRVQLPCAPCTLSSIPIRSRVGIWLRCSSTQRWPCLAIGSWICRQNLATKGLAKDLQGQSGRPCRQWGRAGGGGEGPHRARLSLARFQTGSLVSRGRLRLAQTLLLRRALRPSLRLGSWRPERLSCLLGGLSQLLKAGRGPKKL